MKLDRERAALVVVDVQEAFRKAVPDFGEVAAARGQEAEALAAYRLAVLRATEDVENAFSALVKREAQVGILTQGESSLARARENADAAYRGGVVSLIEVLDADANLLQVRDAKAQAQTEVARAARMGLV